jgi:hypothetical protein
MKAIRYLILLIVLPFLCLNAQETKYEYAFNKNDTLVNNITVYGALIHQHQDFFNKAFSFQGIESGVIINHKIITALYFSTFVSHLDIKLSNAPLYVYVGQGGMVLGFVRNGEKLLHTGWLLNIGYFSLIAKDKDFPLFNANNPSVTRKGLILTPQVYTELNISKWMKFRTGLAYSFYSFEDQTIISKSDLQNIAVSFGFIFGGFNR